MIKRLFQEHPASVNETYFEHMGMALKFSTRMIFGGFACLIHAFLPFLFKTTGKDTISSLHHKMVTNRVVKKAPEAKEYQHS